MNDKKNDDMAGIVSERGGVPDVKPAKSLWPRPHENVRVEPNLEPPPIKTAPRVSVPTEDFETVPTEGYQEPAAPQPEPEPEMDEPKAEASAPEEPIVNETREEPVVAVVPDFYAVPEDQPSTSVEAEPEPLRVREDDRASAVLDAADDQEPALKDPGGSRAGQFIAMAAGVVVALALGAVAFMYGASGLGIDFGGDAKTTAVSAPPPTSTPVAVVNPDDLKAAKQQIEELQARLERLEAEKTAAAAAATKQAEAAAPKPKADTVAAVPAPTPTPPPQTAAPAPASPATPAATAGNTAPSTPARSEPTPAPAPASPPVAPKPRPAETARVEPTPAPPPALAPPPAPLAPPPSYPQSYEEPRQTASPEMPVLQDWAVRDVYNGIAVVQSGRGAPMEVSPGDQLPGGNRVLAIRRLGGDWAVITERGIIAAR